MVYFNLFMCRVLCIKHLLDYDALENNLRIRHMFMYHINICFLQFFYKICLLTKLGDFGGLET